MCITRLQQRRNSIIIATRGNAMLIAIRVIGRGWIMKQNQEKQNGVLNFPSGTASSTPADVRAKTYNNRSQRHSTRCCAALGVSAKAWTSVLRRQ